MMRYVMILIVVFIVSGCAEKRFYMLTDMEHDLKNQTAEYKTIGVERISVPDYLKEGRVAKMSAHNRIIYIKNALWAVDVAEDLTDALIFDLQKVFGNATVVHYPWNGNADMIIKIKIKRFIAHNGFVYLDAMVRLNKINRVVSLKVPVNSENEESIVSGMKKAFGALEREVVRMLDDIEVSKNRGDR